MCVCAKQCAISGPQQALSRGGAQTRRGAYFLFQLSRCKAHMKRAPFAVYSVLVILLFKIPPPTKHSSEVLFIVPNGKDTELTEQRRCV